MWTCRRAALPADRECGSGAGIRPKGLRRLCPSVDETQSSSPSVGLSV